MWGEELHTRLPWKALPRSYLVHDSADSGGGETRFACRLILIPLISRYSKYLLIQKEKALQAMENWTRLGVLILFSVFILFERIFVPRVQQRRTYLFSFGLFGSFGFLFKPKPVLNSKHAAGHSEALAEEPASRHCKRVAENSSFRREVPDEVVVPNPEGVDVPVLPLLLALLDAQPPARR